MLRTAENHKTQFLKGGVFLFSQTLITKVISFIGQLIVAKILLPEDYGLVALSYTVMAFIDVIQKVGIKEILIQKGKEITHYVNAAFWISFALGLATFALTNIIAPFAADFYKNEGIINILRILSVAGIFSSLKNVFVAWLQSNIQFKKISYIQALEGLLQTALTIIFAYQGLGAYSLVLPFPIVRLISVLTLWRVSRIQELKFNVEFSKWKGLSNATTIMFMVSFLYAFNESGANLILGKLHNAYEVGIFFFSFTLVSQLNSVIKINLVKIYLPYLAKLNSYDKKKIFFLTSLKNLNFALIPIFIFLSINGAAFIDMLYGNKWTDAVPVVQVLFIAYALDISFELSLQFVISQGTYKKVLLINLVRASLFIFTILIGALNGGAFIVSLSILIYVFILTPFTIYVSLKEGDRKISNVISLIFWPIVVSACSFGIAYVGFNYFFIINNLLLQSISVSLTGFILYLLIFTKWFPEILKFYTTNLLYLKNSLFH